MTSKKTTIKDIARVANVTAATVSMALNNRPGISKRTREKISNIAKKLNYRPNLVARSMINNESQTIGFLVDNLTDPFFIQMIDAVEKTARENNYSTIICNVNNDSMLEKKHINMLQGKRVDGIIFSSVQIDAPHIKTLYDEQFPFVFINRKVYDPTLENQVDFVLLDNFSGGYQAITHLYRLGHDNIAILTGTLKSSANIERTEGAKKALIDNGLKINPQLIIECDNSREKAFKMAQKLMRMKNPPTAIFAEDDNMALSVREALLKQGITIPEKVGLIGFDDIYFGSLTGIDLSTIREQGTTMGELGVKILIDKIKKKNPPMVNQILLQANLIIRKSCGYHIEGYVR